MSAAGTPLMCASGKSSAPAAMSAATRNRCSNHCARQDQQTERKQHRRRPRRRGEKPLANDDRQRTEDRERGTAAHLPSRAVVRDDRDRNDGGYEQNQRDALHKQPGLGDELNQQDVGDQKERRRKICRAGGDVPERFVHRANRIKVRLKQDPTGRAVYLQADHTDLS